jgi:hypothetical protein
MTTKTMNKFQTVNGRPANINVKSPHPGTLQIAWDKTILSLQASDTLAATYSVSGSKVSPKHKLFGERLDDLSAVLTGEDDMTLINDRKSAISQAVRWAYTGDYQLTEDSFVALVDTVYNTVVSREDTP